MGQGAGGVGDGADVVSVGRHVPSGLGWAGPLAGGDQEERIRTVNETGNPVSVCVLPTDGIDVTYTVSGDPSDPVVTMLHGGTMTGGAEWAAQVGPLAERYRLIVPTFRGHGESGSAGGDLTAPHFEADVLAILDREGVSRTALVAFSHGTMVATRLAVAHPARVAALVLIAFAPRVTANLERLAVDAPAAWPAWVGELHEPHHGPDHLPALMDALWADRRRYGDFTEAELSAVRCPVLLVQGDRDAFVPVEEGVRAYRSFADARLCIVPGRGHAVHRRAAAVVNAVVGDFLEACGNDEPVR